MEKGPKLGISGSGKKRLSMEEIKKLLEENGNEIEDRLDNGMLKDKLFDSFITDIKDSKILDDNSSKKKRVRTRKK